MKVWCPLALTLLVPNASAQSVEPEEFKGKAARQTQVPFSQYAGRASLRPVGDALELGDATFPVAREKARLLIATSAGGFPRTRVKVGKDYTLQWKDDSGRRAVPVRFLIGDDGEWCYFTATTYVYRIAGHTIRLVDCDGDGVFGSLDRDGFCVGTSNAVCPLQAQLALGAHVLTIERIAPDGARLRASLSPAGGTPQQVACLSELNSLRTTNGLAPVVLDDALSAACTEHANYLIVNGWTGLTDPHAQTLGSLGASPEGAQAASRSIILMSSSAEAPGIFWRTYYHRVPLMHPELSRVGVNSEPERVTVLDALGGNQRPDGAPWAWSIPVTIPAPGSTGFPTHAKRELPHEPVPEFGSCGCPLMLIVPEDHPPLSGFGGSLREVGEKRDVDVPVLVARQGDHWNVYGLVPQRPLASDTAYVVEFTYTLDGVTITKTVPFRTR